MLTIMDGPLPNLINLQQKKNAQIEIPFDTKVC